MDHDLFKIIFDELLILTPLSSHMKLATVSQGITETTNSNKPVQSPASFFGWSGAQFTKSAIRPDAHEKSPPPPILFNDVSTVFEDKPKLLSQYTNTNLTFQLTYICQYIGHSVTFDDLFKRQNTHVSFIAQLFRF